MECFRDVRLARTGMGDPVGLDTERLMLAAAVYGLAVDEEFLGALEAWETAMLDELAKAAPKPPPKQPGR